MIYEIWSQFGTDTGECLGIHDGYNQAMQYAERMYHNGYKHVEVLVFDNDDEVLLYSVDVNTDAQAV